MESRLSAVHKTIASVQTALVIRSEKISIHSNGWAHPFKKSLDPFERFRSAIQKKLATLQTAQSSARNVRVVS